MHATGASSYSVGQLADLAGVTVRTLHHYDDIGLLTPTVRNGAGHRRYGEGDVERLTQILFYRELGFPLEQIAAILDDPRADAGTHLRRQHRLLRERIARLQAMAAAVESTMEARQMGIALTPQERLEVFGNFVPEDYEEEAEQRWGETEAWRQSQRRTPTYTKADWLAIRAEADEIDRQFVAAAQAGVAAQDPQAMDVADRHRRHISHWFYDCGTDLHRGLGEMYVADERFRARYEALAPGLATYVRDAIVAAAQR